VVQYASVAFGRTAAGLGTPPVRSLRIVPPSELSKQSFRRGSAPTAKKVVASHFGLDETVGVAPRHNISPGTDIPFIRQSPEAKRVMHLLRWRLAAASPPGLP